MFRGDVWDVHFPSPIGKRPCLLLTKNVFTTRLSSVTVAEITGTEGPTVTHIEVPNEVGLTGRERSWVNVSAIHTISQGKLGRHRGRLTTPELTRVSDALSVYLDLV